MNRESNVIFFFCSPHPLMLVGETPTKWWNGTTFSFLRRGLISEKRVLSLSLAFFRKGPQVPSWCNASSKGGGILLIPFINLDVVSGIQLGLDMLGRKYSTETIHYFDLVSNYILLPQKNTKERVHMARAFLLHLLGAYLFANGKQTVFLRW